MESLAVRSHPPAPVLVIPCQAESDEHLIGLWLHGRPASTRRAYREAVYRFTQFVDAKPLSMVTLGDLQAFNDSLEHLADATRARIVSTVKSLFSFAHRLGYLQFDVTAALVSPKHSNRLGERILTEAQVIAMITLEPSARNRAILRMLYIAGLRVSELVSLRWRDLQERGEGEGQLSVCGKGSKIRSILLPTAFWLELASLRCDASDDAPVFKSRKGGSQLDQSAVTRVVRAAARRAGINRDVSPHWLRHCHASHALDRGCPAHLLQQTLGHASLNTTTVYAHARPCDSSSRYLPT
jgi:integrase/recombinase XerD